MTQFYVSIIFIGAILVALSLVWIVTDVKRSKDYESKMDDKKKELVGIIQDAELMVDELNKFSDYVVTSIESKNQEMSTILKDVEEKIQKAKSFADEFAQDKVVNGSSLPVSKNNETKVPKKTSEKKNTSQKSKTENQQISEIQKAKRNTSGKTGKKEKVIHINNRYNEVLSLADEGMSDTEIAKTLNMGKGEIQLILGVNKK